MKFTYHLIFVLFFLISCSNETDDETDTNCSITPTLLTEEVENITDVSAEFNGLITPPTCESTVTTQGFVYAKTTFPKTDDTVLEINGDNISYEVTNLEPNTKYYVRTFFVNPTGEYYGNQVEFTTSVGDIEIETKNIQNITHNSVKSGAVINNDGGGSIINKGVCWSTSPSPTIEDNVVENDSENLDFDSEVTGLTSNTTYYLRAYATNEKGTTYGEEKMFKTITSNYKVELKITGHIDRCSVTAEYFYYELNYYFDDNDAIFEPSEGLNETTYNHSQEGAVNEELIISIHLAQFDPDNPNEKFIGNYLEDIPIVITNTETNEVVVNTELPYLIICTDAYYKTIFSFNPNDGSYNIEQLTSSFNFL
ncbi:MAG: hypothetical protein V7691_00815 [Galbibacter orientalis]|uniref:hypothetical protein n=1 Tax=Galbibacter orientalis TaxID=453852 RepID=UPI003001A3E5